MILCDVSNQIKSKQPKKKKKKKKKTISGSSKSLSSSNQFSRITLKGNVSSTKNAFAVDASHITKPKITKLEGTRFLVECQNELSKNDYDRFIALLLSFNAGSKTLEATLVEVKLLLANVNPLFLCAFSGFEGFSDFIPESTAKSLTKKNVNKWLNETMNSNSRPSKRIENTFDCLLLEGAISLGNLQKNKTKKKN